MGLSGRSHLGCSGYGWEVLWRAWFVLARCAFVCRCVYADAYSWVGGICCLLFGALLFDSQCLLCVVCVLCGVRVSQFRPCPLLHMLACCLCLVQPP